MRLLRFLPRFQKAYRALPVLEAREAWSRTEIETFQLERLNRVWQEAITHVPYYRQLRALRGLAPRFASLAEFRQAVPITPKAAVRDYPRAFLSERAYRGGWERTSGSTGTPMGVFWANEAHWEALRFKYRFWASWGIDIFDRLAFAWGLGEALKPGLAGRTARLRQPLHDWLRNRIRLPAYRLGSDELGGQLRRMAAFRPAWIYGFSRAVWLLAREAETSRFQCDSLRLAVVTSEPAFPHMVEAIARAFGVPVAAEYGSVECGFLAGHAKDGTLRVREDGVLLETLPRDDSHFDIVLTVLTNPAFPLLRYAIEDVTEAPLRLPERGFAVLHDVAGRDNDLLVTGSGRYLHAARIEAVLEYEVKGVRRFRAHQHADGRLALALELDAAARQPDLSALRQKLAELVEGYPVSVEVVAAIAQTAAGKHRLVVSDVAFPCPAERPRKAGSPVHPPCMEAKR